MSAPPPNHPLRTYTIPRINHDKRVEADKISKPELVSVKRGIDDLNFERELKRIGQRLQGWDL